MVKITETEEEIKIIIESSRMKTRRPDIVLLPRYLKFNSPPIFFERHLLQEIDEDASFCKLLKTEVRIVLIKREKGMWPALFQDFSKEELMRKRLEIRDQMIERSKEDDKKAFERYELKKREEINKEVRRETAMRQRLKQLQDDACREAFSVDVAGKETQKSDETEKPKVIAASPEYPGNSGTQKGRAQTPAPRRAVASVRSVGKISVSFSNFSPSTPKRESQEGVQNQFLDQINALKKDIETQRGQMDTVKE